MDIETKKSIAIEKAKDKNLLEIIDEETGETVADIIIKYSLYDETGFPHPNSDEPL